MAYSLKMASKKAGRDYKVAPLEGVWWAEGDPQGKEFLAVPRSEWRWRLLIRVPDFIEAEGFERMRREVARQKGEAALRVELEKVELGECAHILHVGPYADESKTLQVLDAFIEGQGLVRTGRHHEIYLSDPRKTPPERLKTILMYRVKP